MKNFPKGINFMQQVLWKNREQFFREKCEKISQIVNSNVDWNFIVKNL